MVLSALLYKKPLFFHFDGIEATEYKFTVQLYRYFPPLMLIGNFCNETRAHKQKQKGLHGRLWLQ